VRLFQIEEPEGGPADPAAPGAAIGVDASGREAIVAMSVGGNAVVLGDRAGLGMALPVPGPSDEAAEWQSLFEGARVRAERALSRPVTHAVVVIDGGLGEATAGKISAAAEKAGLVVLRLVAQRDIAADPAPAISAAILAEDLAPPPIPETA
jgi:hypothetical protein